MQKPVWYLVCAHTECRPYGKYCGHIQNVPGGKVNILGCHSIGHSRQKVCMYMCLIPNSFQDSTLCSSLDVCPDALRLAIHRVLKRVAKFIDVDGVIFENVCVLYLVNCTDFVTWTINIGIRKHPLAGNSNMWRNYITRTTYTLGGTRKHTTEGQVENT
jgi:hypothetical protein